VVHYCVLMLSCVIVIEQTFSGRYNEYFGLDTDVESLTYLMLANHVLRKFYPSFMMTIAEVQLPFINSRLQNCCCMLVL